MIPDPSHREAEVEAVARALDVELVHQGADMSTFNSRRLAIAALDSVRPQDRIEDLAAFLRWANETPLSRQLAEQWVERVPDQDDEDSTSSGALHPSIPRVPAQEGLTAEELRVVTCDDRAKQVQLDPHGKVWAGAMEKLRRRLAGTEELFPPPGDEEYDTFKMP